jgi:beta-glucosidase
MKRQQMQGLMMALMLTTALPTAAAHAQAAPSSASKPWMNTKLSADQRADLIVAQMTQDEKLTLVFGYFGSNQDKPKFTPHAEARMGSAGYIPGIARLGVPPQWETDAGVGVATQRESSDPYLERTSLPSGIATAATWNPDLAFKGGAMIGSEARSSGFNVQLAGGVNLARDPRNGRNFEYGGEDPLLAGVMVGAQIKGIQSNNIISTIKHWALNGQETNRMTVSSNIGDAAARQSDFLAFEFAIEQSNPGSVMCAYNRINSTYACENDYLLNEVLKKDWGYTGYVMSDWGGTHSTAKAANAGLDQESAYTFDKQPFFGAPLKAALADGSVPQARLDDMVRRITRSMFAHGLFDHPVVKGPIDFAAHAKVTQADAEEAIVLLKNDGGLLPDRQDGQEDRRHRLAFRRRRAVGRRLVAGVPGRRHGGEGPGPQGLPWPDRLPPLLAAEGAAGQETPARPSPMTTAPIRPPPPRPPPAPTWSSSSPTSGPPSRRTIP